MEIVSHSPEQTKKIARNLAKKLRGGDIVCLFGDLGTGKTVFVQGLAEGLGIKKRILSPSFVFQREYDTGQKKKFYHIDLYRIENAGQAGNLGLEEVIESKDNIIAIEWAEKIKNFLPKKRIDIFLSFKNEEERKIKIEKRS
jgi:tRNA threonylcarbamoyladenosine biosynthesis protein TsaE